MDERDDTRTVQGFLDRGERIPPGQYHIGGTLTVPAGYPYGLIQSRVNLLIAGGLTGAAKDCTTIKLTGQPGAAP